tara:strand:- start:291 stop:587 length:297 start_codon:yes stop_codon:yes gene_type:complete
MKPLLSDKITKQELGVLAELLYYNNEYKDLEPKARGVLIFDYDNRVKIMNKMNISYNTLGNNLLKLRKKGYLKGNLLKESLIVYPGESTSINYNFKIS